MKKTLAAAAMMIFAGSFAANAQTNVQTYYDFGKDRKYVSTTFEMFKGDQYGDTFFFIDHYYTTKADRDANMASAINGTYFEIERGINFWQDSDWKDFSGLLEYDGSSWGAGILGIGAKYFFHSDDFSKTFTAELLYDCHMGVGDADIPIKFSGVWGLDSFLGIKNLCFKGFFDFWGNNSLFSDGTTAKWSFLTEPQLWYACGEHLNLGGEIELSNNFAGHKGFMCNPCLGFKWDF